MNDQLGSLVGKYKINEEQIRKIFERFIRPELKYFKPSDNRAGTYQHVCSAAKIMAGTSLQKHVYDHEKAPCAIV